MSMGLAQIWASVLVLVGLAVTAGLLPRTRRFHAAGVAVTCALALAGVIAGTVLTWQSVVITQEDLDQAVESASEEVDGMPGRLSPNRLAAVAEDELGHDIAVRPASGASQDEVRYEFTPSQKDSPVVCVTITTSGSTDSGLQKSGATVNDGPCDA